MPDRKYKVEIPIHGGNYGDYIHALEELAVVDDTLMVELCYPTTDNVIRKIEVGLMAVRAADSILIEYDFDRDGYVIKQASRFNFGPDETPDPDWQEVAFIQAWARLVEDED